MTNSPTKSPWTVSHKKVMLVNSDGEELRHVGCQMMILGDDSNCVVCDMNLDDGLTNGDALSNANLIAAAPELLHAVQLLKIAIEGGDNDLISDVLTTYGIPAIKKASGNNKEEEIKDILVKHEKYLNKEEGGERADFSGMNLEGFDFSDADLKRADFSYAYLSNANFKNANLYTADFRNADLGNANLENTNFIYADFSNADLSYANLEDADLWRANFNNTNFSDAILTNVRIDNINRKLIKLEGDEK